VRPVGEATAPNAPKFAACALARPLLTHEALSFDSFRRSWMKLAHVALVSLSLLAVATEARDASACGGCFVQQSENTQVTGHRMVLSVSKAESTLWDQFQYAGNPADFAWVLPIHGEVDLGLSSDALFGALEQMSAVTIESPQITCPPPPSCGGDYGAATGAGGAGQGGAGQGGVTVIAQKVVGPYETVQLSSKDPKALGTWLENHGYAIPADVEPIIAAYVAGGFDFLALKLVPGQGVDKMRPVRVTSKGASPVLPLRMVSAGTGAVTPITLWVLGEGRYEPQNFPSFQIKLGDLVWDWDTQSSNYAKLKSDQFAASEGKAWLVDGGEPLSSWQLEDPLRSVAQYDPASSGYGDGDAAKAQTEVEDDLAKLVGSIDAQSLWFSRMHGELSRAALGSDLVVAAAKDQSVVVRDFHVEKAEGTPPACPTFPPCDDGSGTGAGAGTPGGAGGAWQGQFTGNGQAQPSGSSGGGGCAIGGGLGDVDVVFGALALAAIASVRRRRR
jgi:hypothetical protein